MSFGGEFPGRVVQSKMGSLKPDLISDFPGVEVAGSSGGHEFSGRVMGRKSFFWALLSLDSCSCCTRSAHHGTFLSFPLSTPFLVLHTDGHCRAVQARLCCKHCRHVISLGSCRLSMTSYPTPKQLCRAVLIMISFSFAIHRQ